MRQGTVKRERHEEGQADQGERKKSTRWTFEQVCMSLY